ncbi:Tryptophanyl-tRNA synthetase [Caballeronia sordidicola]|uniref:Tryptophanyl-tRNA synthetase n=1 Tax=Caballeronia sordidicola TaxID=196367 RepID=A0A226WP21_CABSO|nr:Tryptophanyl-tRNA synthetase [Caballeronia sordidicola]
MGCGCRTGQQFRPGAHLGCGRGAAGIV